MIPLPLHSATAHQRRSRRGFSLIELLTVTAIIALVMGLASNVMRSDRQRADVNEAVDNLGGILKAARWEARSKSTYVWVCLKPGTYGSEQGVRAVMFASKDGTTNSSPANLVPVGQALTLRRVGLGDLQATTPSRLQDGYSAASVAETSLERLDNADLTISDAAGTQFTDHIVSFNPRGEASVPGTVGKSFIELLIRPQVGGGTGDEKASSILLSRATGSAQIYR
jgi:prepilin-type N-terminal cleavage/methylation domain-containing protein